MTRRLRLLAATAAVAALAGCGADPDPAEESVTSGLQALRGAEQNGFTLGSASAPATLTLLAAPTDLRVLGVVRDELPEVLTRFIKPGRLKLQWRTLDGTEDEPSDAPDAVARLLLSAGLNANAFWPTAVVLAAEYPGAWDQAQARPILRDAGVRDPAAVLEGRGDERLTKAIAKADAAAQAAGTGRGPAWILERTGSTEDITRAVDRGTLVDALAAGLR